MMMLVLILGRPGQPGTNMLVNFSCDFFYFLEKMQIPHGPAGLMAPRQPPAHARTHEQINTFRDFSSGNSCDFPSDNFRDFSGENLRDFFSENFRDFPSENFRDFSGENFRDFSQ